MQLFTRDSYNKNGKTSNEDEYTKQSQQSQMFRETVITLRLGALAVHFSHTDQKIAANIQFQLKNTIKCHPVFTPEEKEYLYFYLQYRLEEQEEMSDIKDELTPLASSKKRRVRHILLNTIFADGYSTVLKKQHVEAIYLALGLNKETVEHDIKIFLPSNKTANRSSFLANNSKPMLFIKNSPRKRIKSSPVSEKITASYEQQSLTSKRENLYNSLIKKNKHSKKEFKHLCQHHKLTVDGAIEVINNWSSQQVGEAVLNETHQFIIINTDIFVKIQQKTAENSADIYPTILCIASR